MSFYIALAVLWLVLIAAGYFVLGKDVFRLLKLVRSPMLLGFSTASSESAYPKLMEQLENSASATASPASCCRSATPSTSTAR
jgi:Na+/H+-dicarboxylate symporter